MNTKHLEALVAIADYGSLSAASRKLGLASATIAEQIAALERFLGATLVERSGRYSVLSDAGHAVLANARVILARTRDMHQAAQLGELRGTLRVGSISSALTSFVPDALKEMTELHPGIELVLEPATTRDLFERLERNDIDCAIAGEPPFALAKAYSWRLIQEQPLVLLSPKTVEGDTADQILSSAPFIRMDRATWTGQIITAFLRDFNLSPTEMFEMSAQATIVMLVSRGMGVSLLPDTGIPETDQLKKIVAGDRRHVRQVGLLCSRSSRKALMDAFADVLIARANLSVVTLATVPKILKARSPRSEINVD